MNSFEVSYSKIMEKWNACMPVQKILERKEKLKNRPFILYGAGRLAKVFIDICKKLDIEITAVCDRNSGKMCEGFCTISPMDLKSKYPEAIILICSYTFNLEIFKNLKEIGFEEEQIMLCPIAHAYFESPENFLKHKNGYEWAYNFYQDSLSKQLVLDRMEMILLDRPLEINTEADCYYEKDAIQLDEKEVFVDGGAFIGDTAQDFILKQNGKYKHIYSFEPGYENYQEAKNRLNEYDDIDLIQKGLWSSETTLTFYEDKANPAGSCFSEAKNLENSIEVISLDSLFSKMDIEEWPTFIKMDIEGSEKEALMGAANIIKQKKPKLAICAYHKVEDIYELPQTILKIRDDYKFVLRQHAKGCFDTVLYAF